MFSLRVFMEKQEGKLLPTMTKRTDYSRPKDLEYISTPSWDYIIDKLCEVPEGRFKAFVKASIVLLWTRAFYLCPAAKEHHHAYPGGLLVHTAEVLKKTLQALEGEDDHTLSIGVIAAIWHDAAKIKEYSTVGGEISKLPYFYEIGHVHGSCMLLASYVPELVGSVDFQDIEHCILSHHGRKEWGSPVEPQTKAAMALHFADMWSSRFGNI